MPPVIGFLISGVIIGPYGTKLVENTEVVVVFAEIGIILQLGANETMPEEFEISIEIANRVLSYFKFPLNLVKEYVNKLKKRSYKKKFL